MDNFDRTTGVLDSWDLLYPVSRTYVHRNKESVQFNKLNLLSASASFFIKEPSYNPVLNSISAGYYPVFGGFYKSCPSTYVRPLIQVTVSPKSPITVANAHKRRERPKKKSPNNSRQSKKVYIVLPGNKKEEVCVIDASNAEIFKEINDNKLLSECMKKSYIKDMNRTKKKSPDKGKEQESQLQTIPECSPGCTYMNIMNKTKKLSPDRSGPPSPQSPVRSNYEMSTKLESMIKKQTINKQSMSQRQTSKSPDKNSLNSDDARPKSPTRTSQQKTRIHIYQSGKHPKDETPKSPERFSLRSKRSVESVISEEKPRSPERYEKRSLATGRPDRIRITGRLGLTEDDKCVLKCDATLNDQPILTQFQGADYALLPPCYQACNEQFRSSRKQRDVKVQAKESPMGARFYSGSATGKESQGTQVDFQMALSTASSRREDSGRGKVKEQCACVSTADNVSDMYENKEDTSVAIKKNQNHSPLIVISVYSKNDSSVQNSGDLNPKNTKSMEHKKESKKIGRSRSPSPAKNSKKIGDKKSESRVNASTSKKTVRETARKVTKTKLSQTQSRSMVRSTSAKMKTENKTVKSKSPKGQQTPPQSRRSSSPQKKQEEPNVTEQMKKALIEDFTKSYTEQMQRKAHLEIPLQTKHNVSNITIDIEGDSDYYNVKLEQDAGINTELTVRNPRGSRPRAADINMSTVGETDSTSLENFLYMPENEPRKRSFSQTLMFDGTDLTMNSEHENEKALIVKDSIEVSHRRETKASVHVNDFYERNDIPKEVDTNYLAQTKHFQGDDCSISNPVTRDREIQKLLGIDKGVKRSSQVTKPSQPFAATGKNSKVRSINENYNNSAIWTKKTKTENGINNLTTHSLYDVVNTVILIRPLHQIACNENIQLLHSSLRRLKPVILTRRQYDKVKRIIYHSLIAKHNSYLARSYCNERRLRNFKLQLVKSNTQKTILHYDKNSQTDNVVIDHACATISEANTYTVKKTICGDAGGDNGNDKTNSSSVTFVHSNNNNCTQQVINVNNYYSHNVRTIFIARDHVKHSYNEIRKEHLTKTASVKDIQYRRMAIKNQRVRFSSSDSANYIPKACVEKKDSCSVHTIFKCEIYITAGLTEEIPKLNICHQKSITPNLGNSANSLCVSSENIDSRFKFSDDSLHDIKPKKAFLKRLISCLVFKISPPVSQTKNLRGLIENGSPTTSFDSYHVSTSLGAIEMSSSLYDTTASFYSDHTTRGAKTKGGFLSSVRGLLSRKNCS